MQTPLNLDREESLNRIKVSFDFAPIEATMPSPQPGLVLVERLYSYDPRALFAVKGTSRVSRVLRDYPNAFAKIVNYSFEEGLGQTMAKVRAKLDEKKTNLKGSACSCVGRVLDNGGLPGLSAGDFVACAGFELPVDADIYLYHPDQCHRLDHPVPEASSLLYLGWLISVVEDAAQSGARGFYLEGLGDLTAPLAGYAHSLGCETAEMPRADTVAVVGSACLESGWQNRLAAIRSGFVLDPVGVIPQLPPGFQGLGFPDGSRSHLNAFFPGPLDWPRPFNREGREQAVRLICGLVPHLGQQPKPVPRMASRVLLGREGTPNQLRVSVVGCGNFARAVMLYGALKCHWVSLRGVCDIRPEVAAVQARALKASFHTADFAELLNDPDTHAVLVATDHGSHAAYAVESLRAGKMVHVEKPPVVSPAQLTELLNTLRQTSGVLTVGYNRPHSAGFKLAMKSLEAETGPVAVTAVVKGFKLPPTHWYYWETQGTRIAGNLVHWIDMAYRLVGKAAPEGVHVMANREADQAFVSDNLVLAVRFAGGSTATISFTSAGDDLRGVQELIDVKRGGLTVEIDNFKSIKILQNGRKATYRFNRDRGHESEMKAVMQVLRRRSQDETIIRDMIHTSGILFAAQESFRTGREVVVDVSEWLAI